MRNKEILYLEKLEDIKLSSIKNTKSELRDAVSEIVSLILSYPSIDGKTFRFSDYPKIKEKVLNIFRNTKGDISGNMLYYYLQAIELNIQKNKKLYGFEYELSDDFITDFAYSEIEGRTFDERLSIYMNRFIYEIEAYIAIGLVANLKDTSITNSIMQNINKPYKSSTFLDSYTKGDFSSIRLDKGTPSFGKGSYQSSFHNITRSVIDMIHRSYFYVNTDIYKQNGVKYKKTYRGSDFDCVICDEATTKIYKVDEQILPIHPLCKCYEMEYIN